MSGQWRAGDLLRRQLGDRRFLLLLPRAVGLQILHPAIATALAEHATNRLWAHKKRAVTQMIYMACADRDMSSVIRNAHEHVTGYDEHGDRYHALRPEVFLFQHATYVDALMTASATFGPRITEDARVQLYSECCDWYRSHGVSDRLLPGTWAEFTEYFDTACATHLHLGTAGTALAEQVLHPDTWIVRSLPRASIRAMQHNRAKELLGIDPTPADQLALRALAAATRAGFALSPRRIRMVQQARP
ncbi:oxygenase MpaB family protein [Nocardia sp. NPDC058058]|uniref:oxygenase MpaB family protein n=1 Tax=Nocardia sp. NPDC058058 TaxID=3346317 RepID=UPI0036DF3DA9